jgi:hypothetical protein
VTSQLPAVVQVPLRFVHPRRCLSRIPLQPGELRRLRAPARPLPPLIGYDVSCPACGFRAIWCQLDPEPIDEGPLMEDVGVVHAGEEPRPFVRPGWVRSTKREACRRCHLVLALEGEYVTATAPDAGPAERQQV